MLRHCLTGILLCTLSLTANGQANSMASSFADMGMSNLNAQKIGQMYGIATQLMSLTSDIMNGGRSSSSSSRSAIDYGGNSVLNEVANSFKGAPEERLKIYNEYGGLPTGGRPQSGFQSILNTFLGSSVDSEALPPPPTPKQQAKRQSSFMDLFGLGATEAPQPPITTAPPPPAQARNILELFGLVRPTPPPTTTTRRPSLLDFFGALSPSAFSASAYRNPPQQPLMRPGFTAPQQPPPPPQQSPYDQYGRARMLAPNRVVLNSVTDDYIDSSAPRQRRQRNIVDAFLGGGPVEEVKPQRQAPIVDVLEMFGLMETTTTTQRPRLFDSRSGFGMGSKGASDIDSILNALVRGGASSSQPDGRASGILSQFFG